MLLNMDKFAALPPHTQVFCAHEYTESNLRFLSAVEAGMVTAKLAHASAVVTTAASTFEVARSATIANSFNDTGAAVDLPSSVVHEEMKRRIQQGLPTVPTTIFKELQYNLFMKCREFRTQRLVGAFSAEEAMAKLRDMKNAFL